MVIEDPSGEEVLRETLSREPRTVRFTPREPGAYPFYCDKKLLFFPSHRERGMEGVIEVLGEAPGEEVR